MREVTAGSNITAATPTVVYKVPTGYYAKWNLLYALNGSGSTKHITVTWRDVSASADINILFEYTVSSKDFLKIDGGAYMVMEEGDYITVTSEAGSTFTTICTFEQIKKEGI
jgi:hypothetical protein